MARGSPSTAVAGACLILGILLWFVPPATSASSAGCGPIASCGSQEQCKPTQSCDPVPAPGPASACSKRGVLGELFGTSNCDSGTASDAAAERARCETQQASELAACKARVTSETALCKTRQINQVLQCEPFVAAGAPSPEFCATLEALVTAARSKFQSIITKTDKATNTSETSLGIPGMYSCDVFNGNFVWYSCIIPSTLLSDGADAAKRYFIMRQQIAACLGSDWHREDAKAEYLFSHFSKSTSDPRVGLDVFEAGSGGWIVGLTVDAR